MLLPRALAEDASQALLDAAGFDRLRELAQNSGVQEIVEFLKAPENSLDAELPGRLLRRLAGSIRDGLLSALSALATPVLISLCLRLILGKSDGALALLCRLACACELSRRCARAIAVAGEAMRAAVRVAGIVSPVAAATLTLTGSASLGAALSPIAALVVGIIENILLAVGLPMCTLAAMAAVADALSERFRLRRLFALLRQWTMWGVGLLVSGVVALLAVEGRMAAVGDTTSARALGNLIRGVVPYVGGSISQSTGALLEGAAAARSAVGITGVALAAGTCLRPVLRLVTYMMSLKVAAAAVEPIADPGTTRVVSGFADVAGMLVALCAGSSLLAALLAGACLGTG